MKKFYLLILGFAPTLLAFGQVTRTVCTSGCNFTTIAAAVTAASPGDIIELQDSLHTENGIFVDKEIEIIGAGKFRTVLQAHANPATATDGIFTIDAGVNFAASNLTMQHGNRPPGFGGGAILFSGAGNLTCTNVFFNSNTASSDGGAIKVEQGDIALTGCMLFNNNSSNLGGAIYALQANGTFLYCSFEDNGSTLGGGAIYFQTAAADGLQLNSCNFFRNTSNGHGGALFLYQGSGMPGVPDLLVEDCSFSYDRTMGAFNYGGGIYLYDGDLSISNSAFTNEYSGEYGGAIAVFNTTVGDESTISNTTFIENEANFGAGLFLRNINNPITIDGCEFTSNEETNLGVGSGAGIYFGLNHTSLPALYLTNSHFTENTAGNGGALYIGRDDAVLDHVSFIDNTARNNGFGGAIFMDESLASGDFTWNGVHFEGNTAGTGGAIYMLLQWSAYIHHFNACVFSDNTSTAQGGAIFWDFESNAHINNSGFYGNSAATSGGALYMYAFLGDDLMYLTLDSCTFLQNSTQQNGGAIAYENGLSNARVWCEITNATFEGNTAVGNGGAIVWGSGGLDVACSTFNENQAGQNGGAICDLGTDHIKIFNSTLVENRADNDGGALYIVSDAYLDNSTLLNNTCDADASGSGDGGAIWESDGRMHLKNTICALNADGGGQYPEFFSQGFSSGVRSYGWNIVGNLGTYAWTGNADHDHYADANNTTAPNFGATEYSELTDGQIGLMPLAANNGYTKTCGISENGIAYNAGTQFNHSGNPVTIDQRGAVVTDTKDIGAYEYSCPDLTIVSVPVLCEGGPSHELSANSAGGTWSGIGMIGNTFYPAANVGTTTISYSVAPQPNCESLNTIEITVTPSPVAGNNVNREYCGSTELIDLSTLLDPGATPTGIWTDLSNTGQFTGHLLDPTGLEGIHTFQYKVMGGACPDDIAIISLVLGSCTNIYTNETGLQLRAYPNPNNGQFTVQTDAGFTEPFICTLLDAQGKIVYQSSTLPAGTTKQLISVQNAQPGIYLLKTTSAHFSHTQTLSIY